MTLQWYMDRPQYVHLYDGGPIDNLGIQALVEYVNRNILGTTLDRLFPKGCLIIAIDATPASEHPDLNTRPSSRRFADYFIDTNALDATDAMLMEARRSLLMRMGIPTERQDKQLRGRLPVNDLHQCNCEVLHLSLRHLLYGDDSEETIQLAERVTEIKTKFWIEKDEQDALYRAANVIMKELDAQHLFSDESLKPQCAASEH